MLQCSGANLEILKSCPRSEHIKHIGIGATIFLTATLALFSGGYALYTIFDNLLVALLFGLVWALVIFNLDRLIVSSMRKTGSIGKQLLTAVPRLLLAFLIAIVISKPIEIRLLETKINKVLFEQNEAKKRLLSEECVQTREEYDNLIQAKRDEITEKEKSKPPLLTQLEEELVQKQNERDAVEKEVRRENGPYYSKIRRLEKEISELKFFAQQRDIDNSEAVAAREREISDANRRIRRNLRALDPIDEEIKKINEDIEVQFATYLEDLEALRKANQQAITEIEAEKQAELEKCANRKEEGEVIYNTNSLPDLIVALDRATDEDSMMSMISLFIMALFIMIETAPIFVKLIAPKGPYDDKLNAIEYAAEVDALEEVNKRNHALNRELNLLTEIDQTEMEQEIQNNKKVLRTISDAHHELIKEQVNLWLEDEKAKIRSNHKRNGQHFSEVEGKE